VLHIDQVKSLNGCENCLHVLRSKEEKKKGKIRRRSFVCLELVLSLVNRLVGRLVRSACSLGRFARPTSARSAARPRRPLPRAAIGRRCLALPQPVGVPFASLPSSSSRARGAGPMAMTVRHAPVGEAGLTLTSHCSARPCHDHRVHTASQAVYRALPSCGSGCSGHSTLAPHPPMYLPRLRSGWSVPPPSLPPWCRTPLLL
jgi:hypothetical protein